MSCESLYILNVASTVLSMLSMGFTLMRHFFTKPTVLFLLKLYSWGEVSWQPDVKSSTR
jgi:hypothetical protein